LEFDGAATRDLVGGSVEEIHWINGGKQRPCPPASVIDRDHPQMRVWPTPRDCAKRTVVPGDPTHLLNDRRTLTPGIFRKPPQ